MNEQELFRAIGNVDEGLLIESEGTVLRRPRWKAILIAAVITVLGLSTCAAAVPAILGVIRDVQLRIENTADTGKEAAQERENPLRMVSEMDRYSVVIDFELAAVIPQTIETAYLPTYTPELWMGGAYYVQDDWAVYGTWYTGALDSPDYEIQQVRYTQTLLTEYDPENKVVHELSVKTDGQITSQVRRIGNYDVLEVATQESDRELVNTETSETVWIPGWSMRYLYWSDGAYLFSLMIPYGSDMDEVEAVIASMEPAPIPNMTSEQYDNEIDEIMDGILEEYWMRRNGK